MPWNGSGTFSRLYSWVADKAAGLDISSTRMDADTDDIVNSGLDNCITRDGQGQPTANLPMAGFRHTGVQNGVAASDYAALGQTQSGLLWWTTAGGSSDAITATYTPAITAFSDGLLCTFRAASTNVTTTPTFAPNGLTAHTITAMGGAAVSPGDIIPNKEVVLRYNLANTRWELLNPQMPTIGVMLFYFPAVTGTVPAGYLRCTGQTVSAATYPALAAVLGQSGGLVTMPNPGTLGGFTTFMMRAA